MVVHTCNPSTHEAEAKDSSVQELTAWTTKQDSSLKKKKASKTFAFTFIINWQMLTLKLVFLTYFKRKYL
jgi:hypothetical protein